MQIVTLKDRLVRAAGASTSSKTRPAWQTAVKAAIRDPLVLCQHLGLPEETAEPARRAADRFGLFAPLEFVARIKPRDVTDPLLRQILPIEDELPSRQGFTSDPVGDLSATLTPGVLQKYRGRALLIAAASCAIHCRYCFRRDYPYSDGPASPAQWDQAINALRADESLREVLLSGGDPLMLTDGRLRELVERLASVPHVHRLRVHTRLPIVIPQRVTGELIEVLTGSRLRTIVVVHANHARELDEAVAESMARLVDRGIPVLNQSVLLRGVNDNIDALTGLSERLIDLRVMPYYLHQLDRVSGAAHHEVAVSRGVELVDQMRQQLAGYAVPRYVREVAGMPYKELLA